MQAETSHKTPLLRGLRSVRVRGARVCLCVAHLCGVRLRLQETSAGSIVEMEATGGGAAVAVPEREDAGVDLPPKVRATQRAVCVHWCFFVHVRAVCMFVCV
jgi:hypothetical protein